ncbi:hypothetical protein JJD41_10045 [Oxynema sp. CENA135]|uniref:arginine synthesis PII-interacting regulator PirA n=1 Tax=Oxynema sp. CENA135 TaxID=984206 RepID=UPI00190B6BD3|nr:hypothetical protein [Oxynema sp. CENA135]MBK4730198.1 hypothetical protein [Oxynema sp. CENA135]
MNKVTLESVKQAAAIHRANLQKRLEHRIEMARQKGDENLVRILEAEAQYLK